MKFEDEATWDAVLSALDTAFLAVDTRDPLRDAFYDSVPKALRKLSDGLADAGTPLNVTLHAIGHAHMDIAYLCRSRKSDLRTRAPIPTSCV